MSGRNPFLTGTHNWGVAQEYCDADSRIREVQIFSLAQCRAALEVADLQKTVRQAIERRMRKLALIVAVMRVATEWIEEIERRRMELARRQRWFVLRRWASRHFEVVVLAAVALAAAIATLLGM